MTARRLVLAFPFVAVAVLAACGSDEDSGSDSAASRSSTSASSSAGVDPSSTAPATGTDSAAPATPKGPPEATLAQGSSTWGVYLAVGDPSQSEVTDAMERAEALGYRPGVVEVGCDQGAAEAIDADPADKVVAVYFSSRADAEAFVELYDDEVRGYAEVTVGCAG